MYNIYIYAIDNDTDKDYVREANIDQRARTPDDFPHARRSYSLSYVFAYFIAFPSISTPSFSFCPYSFCITPDRDVSETFKTAS